MITVVYIWQIKRTPLAVLRALRHMSADRRELKSDPAISFFKLLGTGSGATFTPKDADAFTWALLITIDESEVARFDESENIQAWRKIARNEVRLLAQPLAAHGAWSGGNPFSYTHEIAPSWDGPILAITRAKIAWLKNLKFWSAVPPVTLSLRSNPGLIAAIGIGEAPLGLQGTLSLWRDSAALRSFAYQGEAHARVIEATAVENWYDEELFARFALIAQRGELLLAE